MRRTRRLLPAPPTTQPHVPIDIERRALYTPRELYDAWPYAHSLDARAYAWSRQHRTHDRTLTAALHDHAIDEALARWVVARDLVGVMGGHNLDRETAGYADAARLGHLLGPAYTVATGGGPGAMEAANLGARFAHLPGAALDDALERLASVPGYSPDVTGWAEVAFEAIAAAGEPHNVTLGIPTWHYGHEPPNVFATDIAKYFRNSTREAILLQICDAGIVFLPGAAGTVQEIFQDACENYYAGPGSIAPMILVGRSYWTDTFPAWPLLEKLARGRHMEHHVHLVETLAEAGEVLRVDQGAQGGAADGAEQKVERPPTPR